MKVLLDTLSIWEQKLRSAKVKAIPNLGPEACPCCNQFPTVCKGCPIANYTKAIWCDNTPYTEVHKLACEYYSKPPSDNFWNKFEKAIESEIEFLRKVLSTISIRFWVYINDDWVKVTLKEGAWLYHSSFILNEGEYLFISHLWYRERDSVFLDVVTDKNDCDGVMNTFTKFKMQGSIENIYSPNKLTPNWIKEKYTENYYAAKSE